MLKAGQKVRLNEFGLRLHRVPKGQINWDKRIGTIRRITRDETRAQIIWEGNKSMCDPLPLSVLEAVDQQSK